MKTKKEREKLGKYISYLLRHAPEKAGLDMDEHGYVKVDQLLKKLAITDEDLDWIVENNNKKRYSYNEDMTLIRANQGHSIDVNLELEVINPPHVLYHGTTIKNWKSIQKNGLLKMNRQHVHLSGDKETARKVGLRHCDNPSELLVLIVNAKLMNFDGYKIYISANDVYLTDHVPYKYIV